MLLPSLRVLNNDFIVESKVVVATGDVPVKIVMNSSESIISIDESLLKKHAFRISISTEIHALLHVCIHFNLLRTIGVMVVSQSPVKSILFYDVWRLSVVSCIVLDSYLTKRFESWDDESVCTELVSGCLLGLVSSSDLFQHT